MGQNSSFFNPDRNRWYVATSSLGRGGQGIVWGGHAGSVPVAIKVQFDFVAWDLEQSIYLRCLDHEFIVTAFDQFMAPDGSYVIVMERAAGSAQQLIDAGKQFTPIEVCRIGAELASALERLHSLGIRHRDITPKNVLHFGGSKFKLGDFGIARRGMAADELAMTQVGTPGYFPPEVLKGDGSTPSSDLYQLGLVLLSFLVGRHVIPPHYTAQQKLDAVLHALPRLTAEEVVAKYGETARIIRNMLPRTPGLRHTSATAVREAFETEYRSLKAQADALKTSAMRPWLNGLQWPMSVTPRHQNPLAAFNSGIKPQQLRVNRPQAIARGIKQSPPAINGLFGLGALPKIPSPPAIAGFRAGALPRIPNPPVNGLLGQGALPRIPSPPVNGLLGLGALPKIPSPPVNALRAPNAQPASPGGALSGLLGIGSVAAFAAGEKDLGKALGLGALAALAINQQSKPSTS